MWGPNLFRRSHVPAAIAAGLLALTIFAAAASATPVMSHGARLARSVGPAPQPPPTPAYRAPLPVPLAVLRPFEPPPTPYAAGHRGVDLDALPRSVIRAAGTGRVSFAGTVAGRGVVVIAHPDGVRTEYEPIDASVHPGESVGLGQPIGTLHGTHGRCPPDRGLHWGARVGGAYFDPLLLLRPLGPVRLLPWPPGIAVSGRAAGAEAGRLRPAPALRPRMRLLVGLPQPLDRHMRIDLRGGEARMAE